MSFLKFGLAGGGGGALNADSCWRGGGVKMAKNLPT